MLIQTSTNISETSQWSKKANKMNQLAINRITTSSYLQKIRIVFIEKKIFLTQNLNKRRYMISGKEPLTYPNKPKLDSAIDSKEENYKQNVDSLSIEAKASMKRSKRSSTC